MIYWGGQVELDSIEKLITEITSGNFFSFGLLHQKMVDLLKVGLVLNTVLEALVASVWIFSPALIFPDIYSENQVLAYRLLRHFSFAAATIGALSSVAVLYVKDRSHLKV